MLPRVSVIIRARNASADLRECLPAIRAQRYDGEIEIIVVDNESTDDTVAVATASGAKVSSISAREFSWGRAINRGLAASTGDYAIVLSADATPANDMWLMEMVRPLQEPAVVAAYGRQMPRRNAPIGEIVRLNRAFDGSPRELTAERIESDLRQGKWVCSNACASLRRTAWESLPFDETVHAAEEVLWVRQAVSKGLRVVYTPAAQVYHSHYDTVLRFAVRAWEFHRSRADVASLGLRGSVAWLIGSIIKGRLHACILGARHVRSAFIGLVRLPAECAVLLFVAIFLRDERRYAKLKNRAWAR